MSPKISDFGLSRCFDENQSRVITETIVGSYGYLAPELLEGGTITRNTDLYSLGVLIIEILTGRPWYQDFGQTTAGTLLGKAKIMLRKTKSKEFLQKVLKRWTDGQERSQRGTICTQIQVCYEIALECMHYDPKKRPDSAQHIIDRLHGIQENALAKVLYAEQELIVEGYNGGMAFYNMDRVELMKISDVSHITLSDLRKLNCLRSIHFKRCDNMFSAEMDNTVVLHSVANVHIEELQITGEWFSKGLRCFPALSQLTITECKNLELVPVEDGGLWELAMLQSFTGFNCGKLFSRWPMGEVDAGARVIKPFPTCLRELNISFEPSMESMGLFSNLTSLTSLSLTHCREITMDGFNTLMPINLKKLCVDTMYLDQVGISIAGDLFSKIAKRRLLYAGSFELDELCVDNISAVLTAPICSLLATTLHTLQFSYDQRRTTFTEEQEKVLQLLTSLQSLEFRTCLNLRSLPQGLRGLSSLKRLLIYSCKKVISLPPKEGLPNSLEKLEVQFCSPVVTKQAEKLKGADPWFSVHVLVLGRPELVASRSDNEDNLPENALAKVLYAEQGLIVEGYNGGLAFYNMDRVELLKISDVSRITLSDLRKLNRLTSIHFKRCDDMFSAELYCSFVLHSVQVLHIEELQITGELLSKGLRCFPALSQLTIRECKNLELLPVDDGGLLDLKMLQSFTGYNCGKLFSRWLIGEVGGGAHAIKPFPPSLRVLEIFLEPSMQSMGLLSNLTSLTSLSLESCEELTMDGFNPLITVNLKKLVIDAMSRHQKDISLTRDLLSEIARRNLMHAGSFQLEELKVDCISAVLTAPICTHLAATLRTLQFSFDQQVTAFTKVQEKALLFLPSLQYLQFRYCLNLQSLPQGLRGLSSLKRLEILGCEKIISLPPKEGLPTSLEKLEVKYCNPEVTKQARKLKGADSWFLVEVLVYSWQSF